MPSTRSTSSASVATRMSLAWALVNTVLLQQVRCRSFAVYQQTMRRYGRRLAGQQVLTKGIA